MRTLVPAETLVYLETNDLAAALQPIVDAKPFKEVAKTKPDFSALKGVQLAVAVTGFETSEEKLTDEHSVGRVQPRFVAVADTHAWNYQAVAFAEKKLGGFVADIYDSEPTLERSDKHGGEYFIWTAQDGRKAYALVIDSIIYFGNDESAIDKCLAVKRGEADSVAKAGKVKPASQESLASGYVSTDGVAQIANLVGLQFASQASEESEVQSAIAGILPQLIRNSVTDISWTSTKTEKGIEDKYQIGMPSEVANVFNETMAPSDTPDFTIADYVTPEMSFTAYNLKNPQAAWRSVVLSGQNKLSPLSGKVLEEFANLLFEPYGIKNPLKFLSNVSSVIVTSKCNEDADASIVIATEIPQSAKIEESLDANVGPDKGIEGSRFWESDDKEFGAFLDSGIISSGAHDCVISVSSSSYLGIPSGNRKKNATMLKDTRASAVTLGRDKTTTLSLVEMLAREGHGDTQAVSTYFTETRFTKSGMERKTTSDFGLIGAIIAQLAQD
ncbi:MAG: hypothetical protein ABL952_09975 [Pyrinomonadaceae bacterium]